MPADNAMGNCQIYASPGKFCILVQPLEGQEQLVRMGHVKSDAVVAQPVDGFDVDTFVRENWSGLWNAQDQALLRRNYVTDFTFAGTTDRAFTGPESYARMVAEFCQCFSGLQLEMDEVYWMGNAEQGFLTAERWSGTAIHSGNGQYGPATGAEVQVWGITQHRIVGGLIVQEWMLFNELELMMQIIAARD